MARVKYSKKTSPPRFGLKKTVCVILPRVDVNEFLRERRRRSLTTQNVAVPSAAPTASSCSSSAAVQTTAVKIARRRFRVKKEPPCIFHSQVDINNDDSAIEEIPAVLGEPVPQGSSICLHEITRSMCYMCSPRHHGIPAAEDKSEIWNEISGSSTANGSGYRSWHTPTPFISTRATSSPQPAIQPTPTPLPPLIPPNISTLNSTADVGVGTDEIQIPTQTRDQSTQTVRYFSCKHCLALFTDVGHLIHHKSVHQKMFECAFCPGNFASKNDLKNHMKMHMLPKYYDCVYCPQAFTKKHDIREHLTLHAEQKQFHCQLCPATFKQKQNLRNHEQSHNVSKFIHVFKKVDDGEPAKKSSPVKSVASSSNSPGGTKSVACGSTAPGGTKSVASGSTAPGGTKSVASGSTAPGGVRSVSSIFSNQNRSAISSYLELSSIRDTSPAVTQPLVTNTTAASQANETERFSSSMGNFFQCQHCPISFKLFRGLKNHNICHTRKSGKYVCTSCGGKFMKKISLAMHRRFSHPIPISM
ncbi:gastrula zinc finger protein XlCGF26.1-like [Planococcus citri]|uniref:gastrula zinc finger protein XlCGF26.1-like n=1 Tax=Planococcus citri TaxID=170843 RepID=UPI0031F76FC6